MGSESQLTAEGLCERPVKGGEMGPSLRLQMEASLYSSGNVSVPLWL